MRIALFIPCFVDQLIPEVGLDMVRVLRRLRYDVDFPQELLPVETGVIVAAGLEAELLREAPAHPLAGARRRALLHRFALLAAVRLSTLEDPVAVAGIRAALHVE